MKYQLGKNAPRHLESTIALTDHLDMVTGWPIVAAQGWEYAPVPITLDMLGNDTVGDCVIAAAMHYAQVETANTGNPLTPTKDLALQTYSAITGYDPNDPNTDQGTDFESQLFPYWQSKGIPLLDSKGNTVLHTIEGFAALDLTSIAQQRWANKTFGGVLMGFQCPSAIVGNLTNWNDPSGPTAGGHGVNIVGQGSMGWNLDSWGARIPGTWNFSRTLADEMYCVVTKLWLDAQGVTPSGCNLNGLLAAMNAVKAAA